jgi:hypothetical protein
MPAEVFEDILQFVGEAGKHDAGRTLPADVCSATAAISSQHLATCGNESK